MAPFLHWLREWNWGRSVVRCVWLPIWRYGSGPARTVSAPNTRRTVRSRRASWCGATNRCVASSPGCGRCIGRWRRGPWLCGMMPRLKAASPRRCLSCRGLPGGISALGSHSATTQKPKAETRAGVDAGRVRHARRSVASLAGAEGVFFGFPGADQVPGVIAAEGIAFAHGVGAARAGGWQGATFGAL